MSSPHRLGLFYAAIFLGLGAALPYMPVWFAHRGLSGGQIGLILAAPMIGRVLTAPIIAMWADGFALRRTALMLLAAGTALAFGLLAAPLGFWGWFAVWFVASSLASAQSPLTDVIVLRRARAEGFNFGWPRGMGSAAFILANVLVGGLLAMGSPDLLLAWVLGAAALTAAGARLLLPADPVGGDGAAATLSGRMAGLRDLLTNRTFMLAVLSVGLIQSSHAFYYGFSALAWKRQGIAENLTGVLWGAGVAAEIGFMWFLEPWRRALGPERLLILGGLAALVRWTAFAFAPPLWLLFPLQALHALTFSATFLASLQLVERLSTPANASTAQSINSALSLGMLGGVATIGSGWLFDHAGAFGYLAMTGMSAAGLAGAFMLYRTDRRAG